VVSRDVVRLLDCDPDLAEGLTPDEYEHARRELVARVARVPTGRWNAYGTWESTDAMLGLFIVDGLVLRDSDLGRRSTTEVLGAGDLMRPWEPEPSLYALPVELSFNVLHEVRVAILDRRFLQAALRYPTVVDCLFGRSTRRNRWLSVRLVVNQLVRLEDRLLLALWGLAERWGRVTTEGVLVPLALTHNALARLVGARRPSVTSALGDLNRDGVLQRTEDGWLLRGDPSEVVGPVIDRVASTA
jgi:CRP-like cAMP-binding protein